MEMKARTCELLARVRKASPLVHNITNYVVMNASANILLALGAAPVMAHAIDEVEEMTGIAGALVLNIGTLQPDWIDAMVCAAHAANKKRIPIVLDPVGAGATKLRTESVKRIMGEAEISVLRGNASEVFSLASSGVKTRGVDSSLDLSDEIIDAAKAMAIEKKCVIAISGTEDIITDGGRSFRVANGQPVMTRVTGTGCGLTAVTGAFCAVAEGDLATATAAAFGFYGLSADVAVKTSDRPGSFFTAFLDALYTTGETEIKDLLQVSEG